MTAWSHVTVGVANLSHALALWQDTFGFEQVLQADAPDAGLSTLWSLQPDDIAAQALLRTPGQNVGMVHLVEFVNPQAPVRQDAAVFDLCPKNLDVHVNDLAARYAELKAAGRQFRSDGYSTIEAPNGTKFREIHMPAHDATNVVLLEVDGQQLPCGPLGYGGIDVLVTTVPDTAIEQRFYQQVVGLEITSENYLDGPLIEQAVGLPPGSALNIAILGVPDLHFGSIELVEYRGVKGRDLYPTAKPKALGTLMVRYQVDDLHLLRSRLQAAAVDYSLFEGLEMLTGAGDVLRFTSPAGFWIEVLQLN